MHELGLELVSTVGCSDALVDVFAALKCMGYNDTATILMRLDYLIVQLHQRF